MNDDRGQRLAPGAHIPPRPEGVPRTPIPNRPQPLTDEQLTAAILRALPIDHSDRTTVVQVVPYESGYQKILWGRPEWLAAEILTSIRAAEQDQT